MKTIFRIMILLVLVTSTFATMTYGPTYYKNHVSDIGNGTSHDPLYLFINEAETNFAAGVGTWTTTSGTLLLNNNSSTSTTGIGTGTTTGAISIGTGAAAKTITIGSATTSSALTLLAGTGDITLTSIDDVTINGGSGGSVIAIGTNVDGDVINIGTDDTAADTITIGSAKDTCVISGNSCSIGSSGTNSITTIQSGSGGVTINPSLNQPTVINGGTSTGTVSIGGTGIQTISIGTGGTGAKTIGIGDGASTGTTTIKGGSGGVTINTTNGTVATNIGTGNTTGAVTIGGGSNEVVINAAHGLYFGDTSSSCEQIAYVTLTPEEIKTLYSAGKQIIASPGSHAMVSVLSCTLFYDYTDAYVGGAGAISLQYGTTIHAGGTICTGTINAVGFLDATADQIAKLLPIAVSGAATLTENKPVYLVCSTADPTTGATTPLRIKVTYVVHQTGF